jgi:glycogen debranching enzyme
MRLLIFLFALFLLISGCSTSEPEIGPGILQELSDLPSIEGKQQYLNSPFVAAGDRVYIIGHQDGSFPDLGWHVDGEMGGVWNHPIKLLDGFSATVSIENTTRSFCLDRAEKFVNYPMANDHQHNWEQESISVHRTQFIPDGVEGAIVEYNILNESVEEKSIVFSFTGSTDLRPTWLGERTNMVDADDDISFDHESSTVIGKDKNNPWFVMFGSSLDGSFSLIKNNCSPAQPKGLGKSGTLSYTLTLKPKSAVSIPFFIAGSYQSEESLRSNYEVIRTKGKQKLAEKINRYKQIAEASQLTIPDKNIEQMYEWLKYNTEWLVRSVPQIGTGISAGLPDYPWWFGADATYTLQGALATGSHEMAKETILLLNKVSQETNNNGRIIHEVSTNGAVYNPGNVNETAQFITLVYQYYEWTGDLQLVKELFPNVRKGITWLLQERDPDGNHYPNGSGMMEIPGLESELEMIDVASYTQQALESAAGLARAVEELDVAHEYQALADDLRSKINREWWNAGENSFGDFRGTVADALPILNAALIRSDTLGKSWAVAELKETAQEMKKLSKTQVVPHVIYHNWVVNTPMETGIADPEKGKSALKTSKRYENPFGVFVTGIDRTNEPDSVVLKARKKTFSYTGAVMTLGTGVQAVAAARYGSADDALVYISKLGQSFSYALPGSMYEVSPDFGMITQAWNLYGVAVPIVKYFFGIQPKAYEKSISVSPKLPSHWENVSIKNVKVGENIFSLSIKKTDHLEYEIRQSRADWKVKIPINNVKKVVVNGQEADLRSAVNGALSFNGQELKIQVF